MPSLTKIKASALPRNKDKILFSEDGNTFYITMTQSGATSNMQENNAAFEAWAFYAMTMGYDRVILTETEHSEELQGIKKLHYNRFLYRASCFQKGFDWFSVSDAIQNKIKIFEETELARKLYINAPLSKPKEPNEKSHEAVMEKLLTQERNRGLLNFLLGTNIAQFYQQLPVGLFADRVITGNAIFPSDKAAIDIWGLDGSTFHLIELKVRGNQDLGVLSEVFFYACFMNDMVCKRRLEQEKPADLQKKQYQINGEFHRGYPQLVSANIDAVVAYILTESKHSKLDEAFNLLAKCKIGGITFRKAIQHPLFETVER